MFCLDTNIVIGAMNSRPPELAGRIDEELELGTRLLIPAIVIYELRYGIAKSDRREKSLALLEAFLTARIEVVSFTETDAIEAGEIRAYLEKTGAPIGPYDLLIAAQARARGAVLVTRKRREFERVPGLMVTDWAN